MKQRIYFNPTFLALLLSFLCTYSWAQEYPNNTETDIPSDLSTEIPLDPKIIKGKLDNGLTYYIRQNSRPESRVELRLALNAGSLMEDDDQLGLAHFTEHMAFNGTKNFEKNELVNVLQMAGVKFGAHLNAYTSFDETVYMLTVPTADTTLEKSLQILEDWADGISFEDEEIDKERGVVIEEWRIGQGAQRRMLDQYLPVLLADSRYANRLPIGTKAILENFDYQTIKRFYTDWYRPDLMAIIAVGDIDPKEMEAEIKQRFGDLKAPAKVRQREIYDVPAHQDNKVVVVTDKEASYNQIQLFYKEEGVPEKEETFQDYREMTKHNLFTGMLSQRLSELTQQADPPFMNAGAYYGSIIRTANAFQEYAVVPENGIEKGLQVLLEENEKVKRFGFTVTELERYKKRMLTNYEAAYKERDKTESASYAAEYVRNFLEEEPVSGIGFEYKFLQQFLPEITLEEVNALASEWMEDGNMVAVVTAPEKEGTTVPSESEIRTILQDVINSEVEAYQDEEIASVLIENIPAAVEITNEKVIDEIGVTELTFANGVRAVLKPTDFKDDEILMLSYSPGGHSVYSDEKYFSAANADGIVQQSGVSDFSFVALQKFLADKNANASPYIGDLKEGFSGSTSPEDLETMLQLTHLYFTAPREDEESFQSYISKYKAIYQNVMSNPQYYYQDKVMRIMSQNHPRGGGFPTAEDWDSVSFEEAMNAYHDRFADASDFTFFFVGNLDVEEIKPLLASYLGNLPATNRKESWKDVGIRPPGGVVEEKVMKGTDPKSMVRISFTGEFEYSREEAYELNSLVQALNIKLIEEIREKKSGVYGIGANTSAVKLPYEHYTITVSFPCAPENVEDLSQAVFAEIKKMKESGPTKEDLMKVKEAQRREMETNLKQNNFWLQSLENIYFNGGDPVRIVEYEEAIEGLNTEDLKETANKYFNFDQYVKVVLYPEETTDESGQ
ncbi:M16 family metallopeptidase [Catalinimonas niigatensis]|uniref:M16 family metallopeptidase n=1 Tax=Catalinimonas niigatensis TaxID=1397264 RepID=UPI0026651D1E|nr:M16 family metallopeptidase [Catalinimonas niigatensis]WPP51634.1 insulinase family protein [Catalinimonas niigatensis]